MKIILTFFALAFHISSNCQEKKFDWFEMNIKGKPKQVIEATAFSLTDLSNPEYDNFLDSSLIQFISIKTLQFDSLGRISNQNIKNSESSYESIETVYRVEKTLFDSTMVVKMYLNSNNPISIETHLFNDKGYLKRKEIKGISNGIWVYKRDANNRIKCIIENSTGVDTSVECKTTFIRNCKGDIIEKIENKSLKYAFNLNKIDKRTSIESYKYIYNQNGNWVIKTTIIDGEIANITQRKYN